MRLATKLSVRFLTLAIGGLAPGPAFAHHPTGGALPATFADGLLSGLGHPVIGLDHLAALIGVGLLAARFARRGLALPSLWLSAMGVGVGAHLAGFVLPISETLVALGVVAVGLAAALRPTLPLVATGLIFAAIGFAHGFALGEPIMGAEPAPVLAYLLGLVAVQAAITTGVALAARRLMARGVGFAPTPALRFAGLALALVGAAALTVGLPSLA